MTEGPAGQGSGSRQDSAQQSKLERDLQEP